MMPWRFPVQLSEYFLRRLRGGGEFTFYRAHAKEIEPPSVLLPAPDSTRPSTEILEKIDHECSLRSELNPDWAVRPLALSERGAPITLVLEDSGGETLDGCWKRWRSSSFLGSAVGFTTTLEALHERELIHKGVKPTNVLAHSSTDQAGLMDFGIASRLRREHQAPEPPGFIAGTVPDVAPERTGRKIARSTREATCMPSTAHYTRCSTATCRLQLPVRLNGYIATSRDIRCRLTIERRVCRHVSLRS